MASVTDIISALQNAVIASNKFSKQLQGSLNNIKGQITSINSSYVTSIAGNHGAFTLNATTGITNSTNDIQLEQASSSQFGAVQVDGSSIIASAGVISTNPSQITNSLSSDHLLNNTSSYFDGPTVAQSTTGTWFVSGTVTVVDTGAQAGMRVKLWDGTNIIASCTSNTAGANAFLAISLSGVITSPAGNLRLSVRDASQTTGKIAFNQSGLSMDSTITAYRIA